LPPPRQCERPSPRQAEVVICDYLIEEDFLDDKSNGFQLASSLIRSAAALTRLGLVLALTTLYLVVQGTEVVQQGKRRWVDAHWFRSNSYLKIGWHWIRSALSKGWELLIRLRLNGGPDPEPARALNDPYERGQGPTWVGLKLGAETSEAP
jgi:hypothetical protein